LLQADKNTVRFAHYLLEMSALHSHKSEDVNATVWLRCRQCPGPGVSMHQWYVVTSRSHFWFSGCKRAAEELSTSCNRPDWGLDYLEATVMAVQRLVSRPWADQPSTVRCEQVPKL